MISGTKLKLADCPHCNEQGLYLKRRTFDGPVWRCCYCHSIFTPEEMGELGRNREIDRKITRTYWGCTVAAFIGIVAIGLWVMWVIISGPEG
jgi:hypothetical protein